MTREEPKPSPTTGVEVAEGDSGAGVESAPLGLGDVLLVFAAPTALFRRVEDTGAYGVALIVLLALVTLLGYAQTQTGLIDRTVDQQIEAQLAQIEQSQVHLVDRLKLREEMDTVRKQGEFNKLILRLQAVFFAPVFALAGYLLIASVLYAAVALTGRKPEYHTLLCLCVYCGYIDLAARVLRVVMMLVYRTTNVDTSLALLVQPGRPTWLAALDACRAHVILIIESFIAHGCCCGSLASVHLP